MKNHNQITQRGQRNCFERANKVKEVTINNPWRDGGDLNQERKQTTALTTMALYAMSRKGLWGLLLFLLASIAALMAQDFNLYQSFPEPVLEILGCPPPAILIHLALTGYSFTVVVPVMIRIATSENPLISWYHLPCRIAFYLFYLASTTLPENFVAAFTIGLLLYVVEQVGIWSYMYKLRHDAEMPI